MQVSHVLFRKESSETDPITEIRKNRQQSYHLPTFGCSIEVEHERIEVVGCVAYSDVHVMLYDSCLEREHVAEVKAEDCRHVVVVHA